MMVSRQPQARGSCTPAQSSHKRRVTWAMFGYVVTLVPAVYLVSRGLVSQPWQTLLAILPAIPVIGMFASYARYLTEESDEYQRMLVVRRILTATTVAMCCAVIFGFLSELGGVAPVANYWIAVIWVAVQGAGACFEWLKAKAGDDE